MAASIVAGAEDSPIEDGSISGPVAQEDNLALERPSRMALGQLGPLYNYVKG